MLAQAAKQACLRLWSTVGLKVGLIRICAAHARHSAAAQRCPSRSCRALQRAAELVSWNVQFLCSA